MTTPSTSEASSASENALVLLPLENKFTLYFDRYIGPGFSAEEYAEAIAEICTLDTVTSYWGWFNNLPPAGELDASCTYHLMKTGIKPLWEDKANEDGGSMSFKVPLDKATSVWQLLSLGAIGGILDSLFEPFNDRLNGVSCSIRKLEASICVWNANATAFDMERMAQHIAEVLRGTEKSGSWSETLFREAILETASYKVHRKLTNFGNDLKLPNLGSKQKGVDRSSRNKQRRRQASSAPSVVMYPKNSKAPKQKRSDKRSNRS
eukprot:CAMPEP_0201523406 /NCGR_PEP_ID=MMETSP0161_2-20130828/19686_1 /ASSEMBLY_ACC=CAM_ASM_000251 /TAXON_ID=180227 /ORGANISM="Neoparamoeba aestuarina, Strain SoJaBio B1-5/56/2" /LENGTH=263 /DNA_ID=CAMNT_0047922511 /DNA_START=261 /DNA_END=1052 /DNA_ORIENTATION=-